MGRGKSKSEHIMFGTKYRMSNDGIQWILEGLYKNTGPRTKQSHRWILIGFYSRIKDAYEELLEHKIKATELQSFENFIKIMEETKKEILTKAPTISISTSEEREEENESNPEGSNSEVSQLQAPEKQEKQFSL